VSAQGKDWVAYHLGRALEHQLHFCPQKEKSRETRGSFLPWMAELGEMMPI
jgi:hypothetical protein